MAQKRKTADKVTIEDPARELERITLEKVDLLRELLEFAQLGDGRPLWGIVLNMVKERISPDEFLSYRAEAVELANRWRGLNERHDKASKKIMGR
jgi:hypothetical protein